MKCEICHKEDAVILSVKNKEGEKIPVCRYCYVETLKSPEKENDSKRDPIVG